MCFIRHLNCQTEGVLIDAVPALRHNISLPTVPSRTQYDLPGPVALSTFAKKQLSSTQIDNFIKLNIKRRHILAGLPPY